jgi:cell division protein FtsW (lipid II flippase)/cell division protein FtsI/penicillin-binding protein 2
MSHDSQAARRERILLLIAAGFTLVGTLALCLTPYALHITDSASRITHYGLRITDYAFAFCSFAATFALAHVFLSRYLPEHDPFLLPVAALLTGWGLLLIGRLAANFLVRQTLWLWISTVALLATVRQGRDLRWLRRFRYTWLFGGLALLAATLVLGVNPSGYGPRLWLGAGGVYFQPSELLKLLMIVYLASYLAEKGELLTSEGRRVGRWHLPPLAYAGPLLAMFGLAVVLLAWQQDLGAAMLFLFTFLAMLYLATGQWGYVAAGLALFLVAGLAGYRLSDRIALRVDGWLNPWPEASGRAFQIVQSLLAFGAGAVFGQGLGLGSPTYIPAVHTDFIFAAIGEEFGLAGVLAVVALYAALMLCGFRAAARATRPFERFLAAGLAAGWAIQAWVIMAGNAKLAPIAGVTLPFVSYGGSSLLTSFIALGLLLRISSTRAVNWETGRLGTGRLGTGKLGDGRQSTNLPITNLPTTSLPITNLPTLALVLSLALALLAAVCGYWAVVRTDDLRARDDNPRRVLYEQRIVRGRILDREGTVLASAEVGDDGTVTRRYPVPEAAPVLGYASLRYGTGGIEAAFDRELRGETGRNDWQIAWDELLHRPPHGRDVQLALDAGLQVQAQQGLSGQRGALVLLDAATGEVLAMASSPTYDPQHLDEEWEALREDSAAPLVNRATQGRYQPGAALQTAIVAEALSEGLATLSIPAADATARLTINGFELGCGAVPAPPYTLATAYAAACPAPFADLGARLGAAALEKMVERWALTTPPPLEMPAEAADWSAETLSGTAALAAEAIGQGTLTMSPLQAALMAGTLANEGEMPIPRLVLRVWDAENGWLERAEAGEPRQVLTPGIARALLATWRRYDGEKVAAHWGAAAAGAGQPPHAWFIGVAPATGQPRYAIAVLVEHAADPESAARIGAALLQAATDQ